MKDLKSNEYRCAICGGIFEKGQSEEAAQEEMKHNFPDVDKEDCDMVCDDCYKEIMGD